jgi:membrane protein
VTQEAEDEEQQKRQGRGAIVPRHLPVRAWGVILRRFGASFLDRHMGLIAAGVAYWSLLALFPAIALFVSVYGLLADPMAAAEQGIALAAILPDQAAEFVYQQMVRFASAPKPTLGLASLISLALAIWGSLRSMKAIFEALNVAYQEKEKRNLLKINGLALVFTLGFILFGVVTLFLVVALPPLLQGLELSLTTERLISLTRWPLLFFGMVGGTVLLYRYGPSREGARIAWISWGAILSGLLWLLASFLISWYASSFADFNKTYGSLGAVVVLQTWMWVTALVVITGASLNAEAEHQTAVDTTTGPPKPMGERGAFVADTLGRVRFGKKR